jgi:hypothetical protein
MSAGPIAQPFSEAIQWLVAHNVVQMAQPRPWWIVIYTYRRDSNDDAKPYAMISKNEYGQPEGTYKVRIWDGEAFDHLEPMFARACRVAEYLVRYHPIKPNRHIGIGSSVVHTSFPLVFPVSQRMLRYSSSAMVWLRESYLFQEFSEQYDSYADAVRDVVAQGAFLEEQDNWDVLAENQIEFLIRMME